MASRSLTECHVDLVRAWPKIEARFESDNPGKSVIVTCTWRSVEEQYALYCQGRVTPGKIITNCDGRMKLSKHNARPALALDFAVVVHGKLTWDEEEYREVGAIAEAHGLLWGGRWLNFMDMPHVEVPT